MMTTVLRLTWGASRNSIWIVSGIALLLPIAAIQGATLPSELATSEAIRAGLLIQVLEMWAPAFPAVAATLGVLCALQTWSWDHQEGHVYALSLPVSRSRYALMRFGSGWAMVFVPSMAFLVGCVVATSALTIPDGLVAYPFALGLRFLMAATLAFGLFAALAAVTPRAAIRVVLGGVLALLLWTLLTPLVGVDVGLMPLSWLAGETAGVPSPLRVFTGSWMLIDV